MKNVLLAMFLLCGLTAQADDVMKKEKDGTCQYHHTRSGCGGI